MGKNDDRIMTYPFNRKPSPSDTSWVPGAPSSPILEYEYDSLDDIRLAPLGPPPSDDVLDLHPDSITIFDYLTDWEVPNDSPPSLAPPSISSFDYGALPEALTLREEITLVVFGFYDKIQELSHDQQRTVQEMYNVCKDDDKVNDMCAYNALCSRYPVGLPAEIEQEIRIQPWAKRGKDASDKYKSFLRGLPQISEGIREHLRNVLSHEQETHLDQAKRNMEENGSSHLTSAVPNNGAWYDHNPASPHRRPSARTPNRHQGGSLGPYVPGSPSDQDQGAAGSPSHKRARLTNENKGQDSFPQQVTAIRTQQPTAKREEPYPRTRRAQTPPDLTILSSSSDENNSQSSGSYGKRPRSADSKQPKFRNQIQTSQSSESPVTSCKSSSRSATDIESKSKGQRLENAGTFEGKGAAKTLKPLRNRYRENVVESNQMVPRGSSGRYDSTKYEAAFKFLGGHQPLRCYGTLERRLDHMIEVFKKHCQSGVGQFHVTMDRCESDDDDDAKTSQGCCSSPPKPKPVKCYTRFHADMHLFHGKSIKEYPEAFKTVDFFFTCLSRALTKILFQYCLENNIPEPVFYPNYIEEALLKYIVDHPGTQEGEGPHLARTLGIGVSQIQRKLTMLRAKQINQYDQQKELTAAQIIGTKSGQHLHPPQTFPGDKAYHKLSPRFTKAITSWLINNKDKLTPQNRLPDDKTIEKWVKIFEGEHPELESVCDKSLIERYCIRYQEKHFEKFPLLPQPNTSYAPIGEPGSSSRPAPSMPP